MRGASVGMPKSGASVDWTISGDDDVKMLASVVVEPAGGPNVNTPPRLSDGGVVLIVKLAVDVELVAFR